MYERKLPFIANSYLPFGQEAYERGRHYVHIWQPAGENKWRFRIYKYGKPRTELVTRAKKILAEMQAPLSLLGKTGTTVADWGLWVAKVIQNKYNYTWTEFYFSEHQIPESSPWITKVKTKGSLWADVDPMSLIDMRIYDKAEQEYKNLQEYERRIVVEDWIEGFTDTTGEIEKVRDLLYDAIKNSPLGTQVLCPKCYYFNSVSEGNSVIKCQRCAEDIDVRHAKSAKKTLTYENIKEHVRKNSSKSFRVLFAQSATNDYWIAILGDGTKSYNTEESLLIDIRKDIDSLTTETVYEEAKKILEKEMPFIEEIKKAVYEKFEETEQEEEQEELALAANYEQVFKIIKSIDLKGFNKEADYLKTVMTNKGIEYVN